MAVITPIVDLVQICAELGVEDAVLCPGSRSAALTIAFSENPAIQCLSVQDERSAAYIALGMAQKKKKPVVLVCTSGTAALNFAPAVAEALFLEVPLVILTADRPIEWIHQYDGQTIFQQNIYGQHVKRAYQWQADYENPDTEWMCKRTASEAIQLANQAPKGPVHINIPIREPFYPLPGEYPLVSSCKPIRMEEEFLCLSEFVKEKIARIRTNDGKVLIAVGQQDDIVLSEIFVDISTKVAVLGDSIAHLKGDTFVFLHDHYLTSITKDRQKALQPDLLITTEKSFISKPFKQFIRQNPPKEHWHVQMGNYIKDPFQTLTWHISTRPTLFFKELQNVLRNDELSTTHQTYRHAWLDLEGKVKKTLVLEDSSRRSNSTRIESEADLVHYLITSVGHDVHLHAGNSLSIRYVNLFYGLSNYPFVHCNRGTSGIDGCVSTAVGAAIASPLEQHICLVGDVSFLYDSNALWQNVFPSNLKIIVLNNQGGGIFGMIPGPMQQPSFSTFFQTSHSFQMKGIADNFHIPYDLGVCGEFSVKNLEEFILKEGAALLEFVSNAEKNKEIGNRRKTRVAESISIC